MATPPSTNFDTSRSYMRGRRSIMLMMGMSAASIGSATASTNFDTWPLPRVDRSDIDDSNPSLTTAAEEFHTCPSTLVDDSNPSLPNAAEPHSAEKSSESMATPPPSTNFDTFRSYLHGLWRIPLMMIAASIGSTASTAAEEESEDENDTSPASNLGPWHHIKDGNLKKKFTKWQKYGPLEDCESSVYEVITDKGTFFTVKEFPLLDQGSGGNERLLPLEQKVERYRQFDHKNIVRYLGSEKDNETLYVFLEVMSRGSLSTFYHKHGSKESQASTHTRQILEGLKYLHDQNEIHGDIRGAQIWVGASGPVKVDFGLANDIESNEASSFSETIFWMAPEVIKNGRNGSYQSAADIWSLGCTVLEILTCKPPYSGVTPVEVYSKITRGEVPEVPEYLSRDAQNFIRRCLQVNANKRPTAAQLLDDPFVRKPPTSTGSASPHFNTIGS